MCWQNVSVDMLANGLYGVVLSELLACSFLFTAIQLCPWLTSGFCSAFLNVKRNTEEEEKKEDRGLKVCQ